MTDRRYKQCPRCKGKGRINRAFSTNASEKCERCDGLGWSEWTWEEVAREAERKRRPQSRGFMHVARTLALTCALLLWARIIIINNPPRVAVAFSGVTP